ncbi:hypothetical protein [Candidatus Korobacter versatilis]|nr:hypothetical protein [Candidatus Koribacter versatilis]
MIGALLFPTLLAITLPLQPQIQPAQKTDAAGLSIRQIGNLSADSQSGNDVCFKMRVYLFERNDDAAPTLVRETTCTTVRPFLHKTKAPKARLIPAN